MKLDEDIKLHVVIVDDNPDDHFFIEQAMSEYKNISFESFYEGESFLSYLIVKSKQEYKEEEFPDIVILDINMPKINGFEVFKRVEELRLLDHIRFFILSTSITGEDRQKCSDMKLDCYVKPFTIGSFRKLLERIIIEKFPEKRP